MKESIVMTLLIVSSLAMAAVIGTGTVLEDRKAPEIMLEGKNTLIYEEGESEEILLENMKAVDEKDGDVTDSLRISRICVVSENKAMVIYVAKDAANNIGKLKREVRYQAKPKAAASAEAGLQWSQLTIEE